MTTSQKINDIYIQYLLNNRNIEKTLSNTKVSQATLRKYIKLSEKSHFSLLSFLDQKKNKLTIDQAIFFIDNVLNPDFQGEIIDEFIQTPTKLRKEKLPTLMTCNICCESNQHIFESMPCCQQFICEKCFVNHIITSINELAFHGLKCPYCREHFSYDYLKYHLLDNQEPFNSSRMIGDIPWRKNKNYNKNTLYNPYLRRLYYKNIINKYIRLIQLIQKDKKRRMGMNYLNNNTHTLFEGDHYYGCCAICTESPIQNRIVNFNKVSIQKIEKACVNAENEIVVLEPQMFSCVACKSFEEDYNDGTFKKCPHCGIKTVKPEGCNFVRCGDHRWCWICNERVENNGHGHNDHYWIGPGSSAYSDKCRVSENHDSEKYVIPDNKCNCSACSPHQGYRLCKSLECMNRVGGFHPHYCSAECLRDDNIENNSDSDSGSSLSWWGR
jgi:hypothetical protein